MVTGHKIANGTSVWDCIYWWKIGTGHLGIIRTHAQKIKLKISIPNDHFNSISRYCFWQRSSFVLDREINTKDTEIFECLRKITKWQDFWSAPIPLGQKAEQTGIKCMNGHLRVQ